MNSKAININNAWYKVLGIIDRRVKLRRVSPSVKDSYDGCGAEPSFTIKFHYKEGYYIEVPGSRYGERDKIYMDHILKIWQDMNEILSDVERRK